MAWEKGLKFNHEWTPEWQNRHYHRRNLRNWQNDGRAVRSRRGKAAAGRTTYRARRRVSILLDAKGGGPGHAPQWQRRLYYQRDLTDRICRGTDYDHLRSQQGGPTELDARSSHRPGEVLHQGQRSGPWPDPNAVVRGVVGGSRRSRAVQRSDRGYHPPTSLCLPARRGFGHSLLCFRRIQPRDRRFSGGRWRLYRGIRLCCKKYEENLLSMSGPPNLSWPNTNIDSVAQ